MAYLCSISNLEPPVAGPCGSNFVAAYRCFLDSKEEDKGSDCIDSFRAMQQCFQENPEHYKEFLSETEPQKETSAKQEEWFRWNFAQ